jgi:hypothetical protein
VPPRRRSSSGWLSFPWSFPARPPRAGGGARDRAAAFRAERGGPGRPSLEATQAPERGCVRIARDRLRAAAEHGDALGGRVAARARRSDLVGALGLGRPVDRLADKTSPLDVEDETRDASSGTHRQILTHPASRPQATASVGASDRIGTRGANSGRRRAHVANA